MNEVKKNMFWWLSLDRVGLFVFSCGVMVAFGRNHLRFIGVILTLSFLIKYFLNNKKFKFEKPPKEVFCYTFWGVWAAITGVFVCVHLPFFTSSLLTLFQNIIMIWLVYGLLRMGQAYRVVFWGIICGCVIQMVALKLNMTFIRDIGVVQGEEVFGEGRIAGLTGNSNSLGFMMVIGCMCAILLWNMGNSYLIWFKKGFLLAFMAMAVYVTLNTGSRKTTAAIIVLLTGWLLFVLSYSRGMLNMIIRVMILIGLLVASGSAFLYISENTIVGKRFSKLTDRGSRTVVEGVEEDIRTDMYRAGIAMFKRYPITGVGLAQYQVHYWRKAYSHSDYIEPLACTGLVGFLLYHGFNFFLLKRLLWLRKHTRSAKIKYTVNAMLLSLVVHLLLGFGAPSWASSRELMFYTTFATFTLMAEKRIRLGLKESETMVIGGQQPYFNPPPMPMPRNI